MESIYNEVVKIHNLLLSTHPTGPDILAIAEALVTSRALLSNLCHTDNENIEDKQA